MKNKKQSKTLIGAALAVILTVLLLNPSWLPLSEATRARLSELEQAHFLIQGSGRVTLAHVLALIPAICLLWLAYQLIELLLNALGKKSAHMKTITALLAGAMKYLAVILGLVWGLSILGVNSTAVLAGVGIIGLVLGFGAQSLIEDVITGLFIIFEGKYSIGDIIVLDDFRGVVRDIGVRTTTIEDAGKNLKVVNNSDIRNFQNRSRNNSVAICVVGVSYETDLRALEKMLRESLGELYKGREDVYLAPPRYLGVTELGESSVNLKFVADTTEEKIFDAERALARDIRVLFADKGVDIPFPQVVVHHGD